MRESRSSCRLIVVCVENEESEICDEVRVADCGEFRSYQKAIMKLDAYVKCEFGISVK